MTEIIPARLQAALDDRYSIQRVLGRGGMATVYLAEDRKHGRRVAIKVLSAEVAQSVGEERFLREIALTARLDHPHILPLLDSGVADGLLFYMMPYVEGETLRDRLRREGQLPLDDALRITREVADALAYAHRQGVVHRDVKPENILLGGEHARLADFGIASATGALGGHLTATGVAVGTPRYMSPEQAMGLPDVDGRSDLYSLGCVLFEMLTGQLPLSGSTSQQLRETRPDVPAWVDAALHTAMARDPSDRYGSPTGLVRALAGTGASVEAPVKRRTVSHTVAAGGVAALVLAAVATAVLVRGASDGPELALGATRALTFEPGMEVDAALSPDGQTLAYAAFDPVANARRIYVRALSGGNAVAISTEARGVHRVPQWSPDGSEILFTALGVPTADGSQSPRIMVVPRFGGPARELVAGAEWASWSPDGAAIVYTREGTELFVRSRTGGSEQHLATSSVNQIHSPSWSPDGKWIVYVRGNHDYLRGPFGNRGPSELRLVSAGGGESWSLTDYSHLHASPSWLPDSRGLLLVSNRDGGSDIHLLTLGADGRAGNLTRLTTDLGVGQLTVSADGMQVAYVLVTANDANVWRLPLSDKQAVSMQQAEMVTTGSQNVEAMSISPDGSWLAYDSDRAGNSDIYTMRLPDGAPVQMTADPSDEFYPVWSPDGVSLAFIRWRPGNRDMAGNRDTAFNRDIFEVPAGAIGDATAVVASPGHDFRMSWAPDSRRLAYLSNRARPQTVGYDLYVTERQVGGGWSTPADPVATRAYEPKWSPDGRAIAYFEQRDGGLRVVAPDGSGDRPLLPSSFTRGGRNYVLRWMTAWTKDSRALYIRARAPSSRDAPEETVFFLLSVATGALEVIAILDDPDAPQTLGRDEFATDDRFLYITRARRQADIRVARVERR